MCCRSSSIDGAAAGFDPIDHTQVDPRSCTWEDVPALAARTDVMADVIVNHVSASLAAVSGLRRRGRPLRTPVCSHYTGCVPTAPGSRNWLRVQTPRPLLRSRRHDDTRRTERSDHVHERPRSISTCNIPTGAAVPRRRAPPVCMPRGSGPSGSMPFLRHQEGRNELLHDSRTFAFIADLAAQAHALGIWRCSSESTAHQIQSRCAVRSTGCYDFALPPLMLHTMYSETCRT